AHGLWVLARCGEADDETLTRAAAAKDDLVRTHAQRILAESGRWNEKLRGLAVAGLKDSSPHVRRAAADALGQHADAANLRPLLELLHAVPAQDTHLRHTVRIALRNQLRP